MYFGVFDENGRATAFYHSEIPAPIPDEAIPLSEDQWSLLTSGEYVMLDGDVVAAPEALPTKDQLLAHLATHRWAVETGGIQLNGMTVATDDRSKTMIMGARIAAMANPDHVVNWKMPDGSWVQLDAATITAISDAVLNHVNNCFEKEAEVAALIEAGDITGIEGVEAAFDA